jgi:protein gp37
MAENTEIAWCDSTFNPWIGCTKVSPGCDNCYAARQDAFRHWTPEGWGAGQPRKRTKTWGAPVKWNAEPFFECPDCGARGGARAMGDEPKTCKHLSAKPARRRVFCASLADVFDNEVDPEWRRDLLRLIASTQNLDWLLLTKRIGNAHRMLSDAVGTMGATWGEHWRNVWLGATIVNQEEADRDIPKLLATPAAVRFLSMEPLLGPVEFSNVSRRADGISQLGKRALSGIDWVIAGGESGPGARPMNPDWARSVRHQCAAAGVSFLFKQWGEWAPLDDYPPSPSNKAMLSARIFIDTDQRGFQRHGAGVIRVGKKAAGRLLDGVEHNGFPEARNA